MGPKADCVSGSERDGTRNRHNLAEAEKRHNVADRPIHASDGKGKTQKGKWWPGTESNCRHGDFQSPALPTELPGLGKAGEL